MVENGHVKKFADAVLYLIKSPDRRQTMGRNARINVCRFNIDDVALKWKQLFDEVINEN